MQENEEIYRQNYNLPPTAVDLLIVLQSVFVVANSGAFKSEKIIFLRGAIL